MIRETIRRVSTASEVKTISSWCRHRKQFSLDDSAIKTAIPMAPRVDAQYPLKAAQIKRHFNFQTVQTLNPRAINRKHHYFTFLEKELNP
jgi:lipopolysaccharide biosynthesis protein